MSQEKTMVESRMPTCVSFTQAAPAANTDRELWRERPGDFYSDSIHVTAQGFIGINCGGYVYVKPVSEWHRLAGGKEAFRTAAAHLAAATPSAGSSMLAKHERAALLSAAEMLDTTANSLRNSYQLSDGSWEHQYIAQEHDEHVRAAKVLRAVASRAALPVKAPTE